MTGTRIRGTLHGAGAGMLVVAAALEELGELAGEAVGVGPIPAATRTAALLARIRPSGVVLIGTAGAYPRGPAVGSVIASSRVGLTWGVAALGLGYVPRPPAPIQCDARLLERLDLPRHAVLTTGAITTDPSLALRFADGWTVEHLEAFSVAHACREAGVPFVAVLGIANVVGPDAHLEWLANRDATQAATRAAIAGLRA